MELTDGLDQAQRAAVTNPDDLICVLARAGTGKTRVLSRRIAWRAAQGTLDVRRVLAVTFTTRAARELQSRLGTLLGRDTGTAGTFHAIAYRMIRDHRLDQQVELPVIVENPRALLAEVIPERHRASTGTIGTEITRATTRGLSPERYVRTTRDEGRTLSIDPETVAEVFSAYLTEKRRRGVVDFDDMITECVGLLETNPGFAAAQRWRYRHFFVDEYQDVNPLQQRFLDALLGDRRDLFVVGDPNQAIYAFNGADAGFLTGFADRYPEATIIELTTNHRSTPAIVRVADSVLCRRSGTGKVPVTSCSVTACADDESEAVTIARALRSGHEPGHRWASQAVLVRTNAQARPIIDLLQRAGIPTTGPGRRDDPDAVRVLSFHSAKGLEWPIVHLAGLEEGFVPDIHARSAEDIAEERRLLHVALSRATRVLHCTWARRRRFGERTLDRVPSRWLEAISETIDQPRSRQPTPRSEVTSSLGPTPRDPLTTPADKVRDRLVRWRASTARAASVPVTVVLADTVLDDLVRVAPTDREELKRIPGLGAIKAGRYAEDLLDALHPERIP